MSGISALQRRNASSLQAACCWLAAGHIETENVAASNKLNWNFLDRTANMIPPETADLRIVGERGRISKHGNDAPLLRDIRNHAHQRGGVCVLSFGEQGPCYSRTTCEVASNARGVACQLFFGHRARSDDAHLAPEHVEELGHFIKTCLAEH